MKAFILWLDHMSSKMIFVNEDIMELEGDNDFAPPPQTILSCVTVMNGNYLHTYVIADNRL